MRTVIALLFILTAQISFGQNDALGRKYFEEGKYSKALRVYQSIYNRDPGRLDIFKALVATHQQLEEYGVAQQLLEDRIANYPLYPQLYVELGYNYELQSIQPQADIEYQKAIMALEAQPNYARFIGDSFDKYSLLEWAVQAYERGMELNPNADFNFQLARIYGEMGQYEKMFDKYLSALVEQPSYNSFTKRNFSQYITDEPTNEANIILRKTLVKRIQKDPNILYNQLLSWLYVQQKEFKKSFTQEKAIYRRNQASLEHISNLALITIEEEAYNVALEILDYVIATSLIQDEQLAAHRKRMLVITKTEQDTKKITTAYLALFEQYGKGRATHGLQIDYNHFLAFTLNKPEEAITNLKELIAKNLTRFEQARVKMELADVLVYIEKFNQALIFYSQIQTKVKGNILAQQARYKVAQTSYYKGDFKWSQIQLDVLKKSTSQLIANDAMELSLLISDNSLEDSTQTALGKFARADLLKFQGKNTQAITVLQDILENHKGEAIEDEAILRQAVLYEATGQYVKAEQNYLQIIAQFKEDILADDAYFKLAQLYDKVLLDPQKAREYYEQIVFNYSDSIYFVAARKRFRSLRGDDIN